MWGGAAQVWQDTGGGCRAVLLRFCLLVRRGRQKKDDFLLSFLKEYFQIKAPFPGVCAGMCTAVIPFPSSLLAAR